MRPNELASAVHLDPEQNSSTPQPLESAYEHVEGEVLGNETVLVVEAVGKESVDASRIIRWSQNVELQQLDIFSEGLKENRVLEGMENITALCESQPEIAEGGGLLEFQDFFQFDSPLPTITLLPLLPSLRSSASIQLIDDRVKVPFPLSKTRDSIDLMDFETGIPPRQPSATNSIASGATAVNSITTSPMSTSGNLVEPFEMEREETRRVEDEQEPGIVSGDDSDTDVEQQVESSSSEEEEEEPDSNPIFSLISKSSSSVVKAAWESTTLILVPPKKTLNSLLASNITNGEHLKPFEFIKGGKGDAEVTPRIADAKIVDPMENFLRLHCFEMEDRNLDTWKSIGSGVISDVEGYVRIRLEASKGRVHVSWISVQTGERVGGEEIRKLAIVKEANVYRKLRPAITPTPIPAPRLKTPSKLGFTKWLRRGASNTTPKDSTPTFIPPVLGRVRVIALDGEIVLNWPGSNIKKSNSSKGKSRLEGRGTESTLERDESRRSAGRKARLSGENPIPTDRNFVADLMFLVSPSKAYVDLKASFHSTLATIVSSVTIFQESFLYIKGFDTYTVQRIRRGILQKAWLELLRTMERNEGLDIKQMDTLLEVLENVVLGLLHTKIYASSITPLYTMENNSINSLLELYRTLCCSPGDLGVDLSLDGGPITTESLAQAIAIMSRLDPDAIQADTLPTELLIHFTSELSFDLNPILVTLTEARTPLESLSIFRATLQEIVTVVESLVPGIRVTTDMLIPLLAFVMIKSRAEDLESLTYYVKNFRMGESLAAELDWSFVTFQASLAFLRSDPLGALQRTGSPTPSIAPLRASEMPSFSSRTASSPRSSRTQPKNLGSQHRAQTRASPTTVSETGSMLPPISSIKHHRRQSLGLVDRGRVTTSLYEVAEVKRSHHSIVRKASFDSSSPPLPLSPPEASESVMTPLETVRPRSDSSSSVTSIRNRIVLPSGISRETSNSTQKPTRVLGGPRTLSTSVSSSDLRRNYSSDRVSKRSSGVDSWPLWRAQAGLESAEGGEVAGGESWFEWGRDRLISGIDGDSSLNVRRTKTQDSLQFIRTTSLDSGFDPSSTSLLSKLNSSTRSNSTSKPNRPRSILSISSISSIEHLDFQTSFDSRNDLMNLNPKPDLMRSRKTSITHREPLAARVDLSNVMVASF